MESTPQSKRKPGNLIYVLLALVAYSLLFNQIVFTASEAGIAAILGGVLTAVLKFECDNRDIPVPSTAIAVFLGGTVYASIVFVTQVSLMAIYGL